MDNTEDKIVESARVVFRSKGFSGARMEEIAKEAGINKALLHYYFRSKSRLFETVFKQLFKGFLQKITETLEMDIPLDMKIYKLVDSYTQFLLKNRDLPIFILSEIRFQNSNIFQMLQKGIGASFHKLEDQLNREYQKGNIRKTSVPSFFQNVIGLTVFPFISEPLLKNVMMMDEEQYVDFVNQRRKEIPEMIIQHLKPRE